ncbi:glycosyl hydrolase family 18 protein [Paenibacillus antibioticophila]|uniref:glycosyl hydrolase family 18 protein n=1 Tax=Paenibacillus antibioticophila TaxID=1274374 RepID=UPI0005CA5E57|nr:glycosyl hydrolase family 18 protein [Paenibacillus antibioticophila]
MKHGKARRKSKKGWLLFLVLMIAGLWWVSTEVLPSREHTDPEWLGKYEKPIFSDGKLLEGSAIGQGESLKLPLPVIQQIIDDTILYEEETQSVIITTPRKLVLLKTDEKTGQINNKPVELRFAPEKQDEVIYLPADLLTELYGAEIHEDSASGAVLLMTPGEQLNHVTVKESSKKDFTVALREEGSIHAPILQDMKSGTKLRILGEQEEWYYVQLYNGYTGFVKKASTVEGGSRQVPELEQALSPGKEKWKSKKVNLTWEAVYQVAPKPASIGELPGVNVVSPTWFSLIDGEGNVKSKADSAYVNWAHNQGMQVWGLFSNSFEPDLTTEALSSFDKRMTTILQMLHYAKLYDLDGINIDYENVYTKDGPNLTQFMRELRPLASEYGLVVSIDVTPKSNSEMWSAFLDRRALAPVVDYLILMAYDEHWAASPVSGSVASLPWVEASVNRILQEDGVDPDQMILGIPLYTRVWSETKVDGKTEVKSKAIGMKKAKEIIETYKLTPEFSADTGQNYVEYKEGEVLNRIWLEDAVSLQSRVDLAKSLGLAGVATWTRSFASAEAWDVLKQIIE